MRGRCLACLLILALAACGGGNDDGSKLQEAVVSWSATLSLTANAWLAGDVPSRFGRVAVSAAVEELGSEAGKASPSLPRPLTESAAKVIAIAHDLDEAFDRHDRAAAARAARELDALARRWKER
jgi:hypothetical protein